MGVITAILKPIIDLLLYITYAVYVVFGLGIICMGVVYYSQIDGAEPTVAIVCGCAGFFMVIVGAAAIFGTNKHNWLVMLVVLLVDVALFCALICGCMVAYVIAFRVSDPIEKAVKEAFKTQKAKENAWAGVIQSFDHGGPAICKTFQTELTELKVKEIDRKFYAGNCSKVYELGATPQARIDLIPENKNCLKCWIEFEFFTTEEIKTHIKPACYAVFGTFFAVVITICLNMYMMETCNPDEEDDDEDAADKWTPDGIPKIISLVVTGLVMLMGLLLFIMGIFAHITLTEDPTCSSVDVESACTNWAVVGVIILGAFFFLLGGLNVAAVLIGGFLGKLFMLISTIAMFVLSLVLLIVGMCFALIAGAITSINEQYDLNFEKVRAQANSHDSTKSICPSELSDEACKVKLQERTEDAFTTIAWILLFTCIGFLFTMFVTLQAVKIFLEDDDDDDDDDEGNE